MVAELQDMAPTIINNFQPDDAIESQEALAPKDTPTSFNGLVPEPANPAGGFPVVVRSIRFKGRGFFATAPLLSGATILASTPVATIVCEDWAGNVCTWCHRFDDRKRWKIKAVETEAEEEARDGSNVKMVFCSAECKEKMKKHGLEGEWEAVLKAVDAIETEVIRRKKAHEVKESKGKRRSRKDNDWKPGKHNGSWHVSATLLSPPVSPDMVDLEDVEAVKEWLDEAWETIIHDHDFVQQHSTNVPSSDQRELLKLIVGILCRKQCEEQPQSAIPDGHHIWVESGIQMTRPTWSDLLDIQDNEVTHFRHHYRLSQTHTNYPTLIPASDSLTTRDYLRILPKVVHTQIILYLLLCAAVPTATVTPAQSSPLLAHTHATFRAVYYRELANSFGIWDPPVCTSTSEDQEQELLGYAIHVAAVYFNHSCAPNVTKFRVGRMMRFAVNRDVAEGEELTISYGSVQEPVEKRRERLWCHYYFWCRCDRCLQELEAEEGGGMEVDQKLEVDDQEMEVEIDEIAGQLREA